MNDCIQLLANLGSIGLGWLGLIFGHYCLGALAIVFLYWCKKRSDRHSPEVIPELTFNWRLGHHHIKDSHSLSQLQAVGLSENRGQFHLDAVFRNGTVLRVGTWRDGRSPLALAREWNAQYGAEIRWGALAA